LTAGSLISAIVGAWHIVRLARRENIDVLMPRSVLPSLSVLVARTFLKKLALLVDCDGLPVDERVDFSGTSPRSIAAAVMWSIEKAAVRRADAVLTRSVKASRILQRRAGAATASEKFFRVANCRDESRFRPVVAAERNRIRASLGIPASAPVIVYVGSSFSGKYRGDRMLDFFALVVKREAAARFLILTTEPEEATAMTRQLGGELASLCHVLRVAPEDVPSYLSASDLGVALIEPRYSMRAAAAIKVGEYLLCGLPVVATAGVGDADETIPREVCFFLDRTDPEGLSAAVDWFVDTALPGKNELVGRSRQAGISKYSFSTGIAQYREALAYAGERRPKATSEA